MNYSKLDASLASALAAGADDPCALTVALRAVGPPDPEQVTLLKEMGVADAESGRLSYTATLTPDGIARLSQQPWVHYVKLAQQLHLARPDDEAG